MRVLHTGIMCSGRGIDRRGSGLTRSSGLLYTVVTCKSHLRSRTIGYLVPSELDFSGNAVRVFCLSGI